MRQSQLFSKVKRDFPKDEVAKNAQYLIRAGYIHKEMAGVYALLPLGLRVIERIKGIVREEMNAIGAQEILMTSLQRKELWEQTNRWDDEKVDVWFKSHLKNNVEIGFGWSHEEPITKMMIQFVESFRDLPTSVYQFQTKLRNELRAKSGIMRGREFLMKDLYSYSQSEEQHQLFYESVVKAYNRIFQRVGIGEDTFFTFASGGAFTQFSHEFQTRTDAGEDIVYVSRKKNIAVNEEVLTDEVLSQLDLQRNDLERIKTSEVGNIFSFGGKKCEELGLYFKDKDGVRHPVILGSYGIGITRLMGVIVEKFCDEKGLVWPKEVAPFDVHLVVLDDLKGDSRVRKTADNLYETMLEKGVDVLYDDRPMRAGEKFSESDFLGVPLRVVVSARTLEEEKVEIKKRTQELSERVSLAQCIEFIQENKA